MSEQWFVLSYEETPGILLTSERDLLGFDSYDLETGKHIPDWNPNAFLRSASPKHDGDPEDVLADALGVPVFSARLREALHGAGIAPNDLQYLPVRVFKSTGEEVKGFAFANVISRVAAVDYEHSFTVLRAPLSGPFPSYRISKRTAKHPPQPRRNIPRQPVICLQRNSRKCWFQGLNRCIPWR